jgi:hypothetical protein
MVPLTRSEALAERALDGDLTARETVLKEADRHHHETVERVLLEALRPASGPPWPTMWRSPSPWEKVGLEDDVSSQLTVCVRWSHWERRE